MLLIARLAALCLLVSVSSASAAPASRSVRDARVTLTPMANRLESLGLEVVAIRGEVVQGSAGEARPSFRAVADPALRVEMRNGVVTGFAGEALAFQGGFLIRVRDPETGAARAPLAVVDFSLELASGATPVRFRTMDPSASTPLAVRSAAFGWDAATDEVKLHGGDLYLTPEWARRVGRDELAGEWIGGLDVTLLLDAAADEAIVTPGAEPRGGTLDVLLGELYGMLSAAHEGTYPNGTAGLAAATTSCNNGTVNVPWNEPMAETHPFIGLAMFRIENGVLEQIGRNWIKHGWFAFANDQCSLGCVGGGGTYLAVGCSDTYSAYNNASLYTLGPREEVNPHTGQWTACGSFFDATPADCERDYVPTLEEEQFNVDHRIHVADGELNRPGAVYRYEGVYYVAGDQDISNNIGWRECTMSWSGSNWSFDDVNPLQLAPEPGPVVASWGDQTSHGLVSLDDGEAWLSVAATDLGGGQWHYEYAFYNRTSARGIREFSVPVGSASISSVGFRDLDDDAGNDWTWQIADGLLTWSTDDWATDPSASVLEYQMLFNFRFDADAAPQPADARGSLFRPGNGTEFFLATQAPAAGATDAPLVAGGVAGSRLTAVEPNPFADGTTIRYSRPDAGPMRLSVIDVTGRTVRTLLDGASPGGSHSVSWDGRDDAGRAVTSGVYFVRLEDGEVVRTSKLTRLR